jgi:DnaJ-class molecular chaperone
MFKEVTFSYNILSDPDKRRQYDNSGFEVISYPPFQSEDNKLMYSTSHVHELLVLN